MSDVEADAFWTDLVGCEEVANDGGGGDGDVMTVDIFGDAAVKPILLDRTDFLDAAASAVITGISDPYYDLPQNSTAIGRSVDISEISFYSVSLPLTQNGVSFKWEENSGTYPVDRGEWYLMLVNVDGDTHLAYAILNNPG